MTCSSACFFKGKSTCAQLLLRFYDPEHGSIRVNDGPAINDISIENYRQQIAIVGQEPVNIFEIIFEK